jgi:hypothetical protein
MTVKMRAEIVTNESGLMRGELHSQYLEYPYVFFDLIRMIERMEEVFNSKGFPQAFLKPRTFNEAGRMDRKNKQLKNDAMKDIMDVNNTEVPDGSKCTFEIAVRFRQNATWQGQITWAEKNLKQNFRSVLEMLRLMDEALMEDVKDKKVVEWESRGAED